ncbi:class I SAM-dependent methyltransferase [Actinomadura sp. KC216]|uniref:class I SAM-dependent methyltransferase n=1 Tax=Actinomadura sp. KC216 TaxID=2530370 RepID=UPI00104840B1|nr:class I SAM-dependent methyltransferase [Actinomadura sp. KC216]TDB90160.1 class I SAM-dependent methyltransferase [Actinomadura sp. KC216]
MSDDPSDLLARGWDDAAEGYDRYFVPRFAPWVATATSALHARTLPPGPILVPCCGTFPELPALAAAHPGREIVGIDLSPGMLARARRRTAAHPQARLVHGDAVELASRWPGEAAAVVSVFGLQQLPDPAAAITGWVSALRPGGVLSVLCWPDETETDGPFALLDEVIDEALPNAAGSAAWHLQLAERATSAGARVEHDEPVSHRIDHPDAESFWTAMVGGGPLHKLVLSHGEEFTAELGKRFMTRAPSGPWHHHPTAHWLVAHAT